MMDETKDWFRKKFGYTPTHVVRVPGRVEILGHHTAAQEGLVASAAIDRWIFIASSPRTDGRVRLVSSAFPGREEFYTTAPETNLETPWADYVKGVLAQLRRHGIAFPGFDALLHSNLPTGLGLGSSAALTVAAGLTLRMLAPFTLTESACSAPPSRDAHGRPPRMTAAERRHLARACYRAETEFAGANCRPYDHLTCLFGRAFHAVETDCQTLAIEPVPMVGELAWVLCDSGVARDPAAMASDALEEVARQAAETLGVKSLRRVDLPMLTLNAQRLSPRQLRVARHVTGEIQRTIFASRALHDGDFEQFGQYLYLSHESCRDHLHNSTAELDLLVDLSRTDPDCLGARLTGEGHGGATLHLVRRAAAQRFMKDIAQRYEERSGLAATPMLLQPVDGAD